MSSISKMQIRGIRSFSPDHDETIEFYSPLTMIVGANGCGKTTIIESLKFATTGSLPPNTKGGSSLINDPGMTDTTEVKAHIKLRFQNRSNTVCVAVRSLQVTRKRTKLEYKALEGVLRTTNEDGENVSISMKCSDMDKLIPENLGVSPAILENVIFVHQEDSNWPMQEGMVLKKKFDDVFESTRYTKALEALTKTKKEFQSKAKDLKADLAEFGAHLITAQQTNKELATCEENQEVCNTVVQGLTEKLSEVESKIEECNEKLSKYHSSSKEIEKLASDVNQKEQIIQERVRSLEELLNGDDSVLQATLSNFENVMKSKSKELDSIKSKIDTLQQEIQDFRKINDGLNTSKGESITLQNTLNELKEEQINLINSLKTKYSTTTIGVSSSLLSSSIPIFTNNNPWTFAISKECLNLLHQDITRFTNEYNNKILSPARDSFLAIENQKNEIANNLQKAEIELKLKSDEIISLNQESEMKRIEFNKSSMARGALQRSEAEFESASRNYEEFMENYTQKSNDYKKQLKEITDTIRDLSDQIANDSQLLQNLSDRRSELSEMEGNIKQIDGDISTLHLELQSIFSFSNREYLQDVTQPTTIQELETLVQQIEKKSIDSNKSLSLMREELSHLKSEFAANDALVNTNTQTLQLMSQKLKDYVIYEKEMKEYILQLTEIRNHKILTDSELDPFSMTSTIEELMIAIKSTEDEARELLIISKSSKVFLKKLKKAKLKNPDQCPCCGQMMNNSIQLQYEQRTKELFPFASEDDNLNIQEHDNLLKQCTALHEKFSILYQKILPLQHQHEEFETLSLLVKDYHKRKENNKLQIQSKEMELNTIENNSHQISKILRNLQDLINRWKMLEMKKMEILEKRKRIDLNTSSISSSSSTTNQNRSIDEIEKQNHLNMEKKDHLLFQKEKITQDITNLEKKMFSMKTSLQDKEKDLMEAKLENSRILTIETSLKQLENKLIDLDNLKKSLMNKKKVISNELNDISLTFNSLKNDVDHKESEYQRILSLYEKDKNNLSTMIVKYDEIMKKMNNCNLSKITEKLSENNREIMKLENMINKELEPNYNKMKNDLLSQEKVKKNIINNLELRNLQQDLIFHQQLLKEKESQYHFHSNSSSGKSIFQEMKSIEKKIQQLNHDRQSFLSDRDQTIGQLEILKKQSIDLKKKLNQPLYKGIEDKHRKKLIEMETTTLVVSDLDNYYAALDRALQDFHTLKIKEINKIIRELWQVIYQGQDIDTIEIQSGADINDNDGVIVTTTTTTASSSSASGSRSYNYRVVMKKGDIPLDMRGRCSAGQKVLAAIVIRLALAETFCLNCGILALDEPTTNLDDANKTGLAAALARLIIARSKQQNFQLICITHDEEFVQMMRTELSFSSDFNLPEYYFRVYRSEEGNSGRFFSHIERIPWEDM